MVIIINEKCILCSNKKLNILKIYTLDPYEFKFFIQYGIRRVRISCDCKKIDTKKIQYKIFCKDVG